MRMNWMFLLCWLVSALPSHAFLVTYSSGGKPKHWDLVSLPTSVHTNTVNRNTRAVRYFLASDAYSPTNTAAELNALRACFAQWQSVSGTVLKFEDAGLVAPGVDINTSDNTNVVYWAKTSTLVNGGITDIHGALGMAFTRWFSDGTLVGGDVVLNGVEYSWFTDFTQPANTNQFVESTAIHEFGHFIGFGHSPLGAATLYPFGSRGVDAQTGLSPDEIAGAWFLYGTSNHLQALGTLRGNVTCSGTNAMGVMVTVETNGIAVSATLTDSNGVYTMSALVPGNYEVRVTPLDPDNAARYLLRGRNISSEYINAVTGFLPIIGGATMTAGVTNTRNFALLNGEAAFRITNIRKPTTSSGSYSWGGTPALVYPGQRNLYTGVASPTLPTSGATLTITGDGITWGEPIFATLSGLNFISLSITIASNATPGVRSFVVEQGNNLAYANGFLEVVPLQPDNNFDGLDDVFQRQYFSLFTAPEAAPGADPDSDGLNNASEYVAGTVPTNSTSVLAVETVQQTSNGSTVFWHSVSGKRYQLFSRLNLTGAPWQPVGSPVTANSSTASVLDAAATGSMRFYRVQVLP